MNRTGVEGKIDGLSENVMRELHVNTPSKSYPVTVGAGTLTGLADHLRGSTTVVVVTDETVAGLYGRQACESLHEARLTVHEWTLPAGEQSKSLWQAECLYDFLASKGVDRQAAIIALGGGVVGDLAGFVASTWMRGVRFVNCPTTLLSAIDASIGGKTGLNHNDRKNLIGTIYQPDVVVIDTVALGSLPRRELSSAMAESLKHGLIADAKFFQWQIDNAQAILSLDPGTIERLISRNIEIKARIVERDESDQIGERAKLNFGHTIGHALETMLGYQLKHGECVGLGMLAAASIAAEMGRADPEVFETLRNALELFGLPTLVPTGIDADQLLMLVRGDKKAIDTEPRFVLPVRLGKVTTNHEVDIHLTRSVLGRLTVS